MMMTPSARIRCETNVRPGAAFNHVRALHFLFDETELDDGQDDDNDHQG